MTPPAGSSSKGLLSEDDYLAPPHIPAGQPPKDVLNTIWLPTGQPPSDLMNIIWRRNQVFLSVNPFAVVSGL